MGNIISRIFGFSNGKSKIKNEILARIDGSHIRYVTEKHDGNDDVIGRDGCINIRDGELILLASGEILFRCDTESVEAWELMSGNGVCLTGMNRETGENRSVIAYYVYHRK